MGLMRPAPQRRRVFTWVKVPGPDSVILVLIGMGGYRTLVPLGIFDKAIHHLDEAMRVAEALSQPFGLATGVFRQGEGRRTEVITRPW